MIAASTVNTCCCVLLLMFSTKSPRIGHFFSIKSFVLSNVTVLFLESFLLFLFYSSCFWLDQLIRRHLFLWCYDCRLFLRLLLKHLSVGFVGATCHIDWQALGSVSACLKSKLVRVIFRDHWRRANSHAACSIIWSVWSMIWIQRLKSVSPIKMKTCIWKTT